MHLWFVLNTMEIKCQKIDSVERVMVFSILYMKENQSLFFISGKRTPFGSFGGSLRDINPTDLCVGAAQVAIEKSGVTPSEIDHVIFGNVLHSAVDSIYTPRHVGLKLKIPVHVPALGINRLCGSGFQVVIEAYHQMLAGDSAIALIGGVENMSMTPYVLRQMRWGHKMGTAEVQDMMTESLTDSLYQTPMAITAENLAVQYKISRAECDQFAFESQSKTKNAQEKGYFEKDIAPLTIMNHKKQSLQISKDEHPKPDTSLETLAKLKAIFKKDGVVTAGNASGIVDGAAAMVVATEEKSKNLKPIGRLAACHVVGCDPTIMGIGPVEAIRGVLKKSSMTLSQIDLIEVNEAFAAQTLAVQKALEIPSEILNVNGGAIAIGHPLAASGTRITIQLLNELKRRNKRWGIVSACIGGGQGIALLIEAF